MRGHLLRQPSKRHRYNFAHASASPWRWASAASWLPCPFGLKPEDGLSIAGAIALLVLAAAPAAFVPLLRSALYWIRRAPCGKNGHRFLVSARPVAEAVFDGVISPYR